jgi:hypothetical protein
MTIIKPNHAARRLSCENRRHPGQTHVLLAARIGRGSLPRPTATRPLLCSSQMQLTPAQLGMSLMIHGSMPMMPFGSRAEGIARGRQDLIRITRKDFRYDLRAWHDYLTETNEGGYKWGNRHRGIAKAIETAQSDADWQQAVEFAVSQSLLEQLSERDDRQREAVDRAERQWAGKIRTCPKCGTEFRSVRNRGQCPSCSHIFFASHPETGRKMWWTNIL